MRTIVFSKNYKKSMKDVRSYPAYDAKLLEELILKIANGEKLDRQYNDHELASNSSLKDIREFHLKTNLVVMYKIYPDRVELIDIGKHNKIRLTSSL